MTNVFRMAACGGADYRSGGTLFEIAASQFIINLRYSLMSITFSKSWTASVTLLDRFLIAFVTRMRFLPLRPPKNQLAGVYVRAVLTPYLGWSAGTIVGAVAGNILPALLISSLGIAIYGMFIAIVVPPAKENKNILFCVIIAIAMSCAFRFIPLLARVHSGFVVIICAWRQARLRHCCSR
jgi:predicted branched-subunit amino acid permease